MKPTAGEMDLGGFPPELQQERYHSLALQTQSIRLLYETFSQHRNDSPAEETQERVWHYYKTHCAYGYFVLASS